AARLAALPRARRRDGGGLRAEARRGGPDPGADRRRADVRPAGRRRGGMSVPPWLWGLIACVAWLLGGLLSTLQNCLYASGRGMPAPIAVRHHRTNGMLRAGDYISGR